ncbi:hypothetical protein [Lyngbya confervoides]|uniref:DNA primase/polymerase bifunctional N-terminal domain-containing protein n=1 Tax=Lyngbya confervoides BDU141951 TaxID=1574623 RepID=A0ABD4T857_9CYAN|nr:hypothetical protein [Lyngbya confervoides]MCM1984460.1 hypothetical protein [Lyngbya confervoides BDU141951]
MQTKQAFDGSRQTRKPPEKKSSKRNARKPVQRIPTSPKGSPQPRDPIGQKLSELFANGWDWIFTPAPEGEAALDWRTMTDFPLTPVQMWELHQDPECVIGIRPKDQTRWLIIDIDRGSPHHPDQAPERLDQIRAALEDIGICRTQLNQSSHSGGLHLYCPLPEPVSSFWLSVAAKYALESIDIRLKSGECEIFPNPKRYARKGQGFSHYAAIRLPMQPESGFIPLDEDLTPLPWSLEQWLSQFETQSQQQDLPRLHRAIADAKTNWKVRKNRDPKSVANWEASIAREKAEGWTGPGQTNEKLKTFGCEARVFLGLEDLDAIAEHIYQSAIASPGFYEYSRHSHEIRRRSYEVAQWAMKYYWPYGSAPQRSVSYRGSTSEKVIDFTYHQKLKQGSQERIQEAIAQLRESQRLAPGISERASQLIQEAKVSRKTLYKPHNLELWHPKFDPSSSPESPSPPSPLKTAEPQTEQACLPDPPKAQETLPERSPEPLIEQGSLQPAYYEGFEERSTRDGATAALPPQGQGAAKVAYPFSESSVSTSVIRNWDELKASLSPKLQAKITQKQRQLSSQLLSDRISPPPDSVSVSPPDSLRVQEFVALSPREPTDSERQEFEEWYPLAQEFGLVSDYEWQFREYFVLSQGDWLPYNELSSDFSVSCLRRYLAFWERPRR